MKITSVVILQFVSFVAYATNYPGMNEADMQKMMQQMQQMQSCMEKVDREKLKALEVRAHQMEAQIKSLCADGKRDKAQDEVISFAKTMSNDPTLREMKKCGEKMKSMMTNMPKIPYADMGKGTTKDYSGSHVCD